MSRLGPVHRRWLTILMILLSASPSAAFAADGDLDPTFGSGGIVVASFKTFSRVFSMTIQPDGKILVGGSTDPTGSFLARYHPDGSPDPTLTFEPPMLAARDLAVSPDGAIRVVGAEFNGTDADAVLAGVGADGVSDLSVRTDVSGDHSSDDEASAVVIQPDGMILVGGSTESIDSGGALVIRYNPIGSLDLGFGTDGIVVTEIGAQVDDLILQPDGKIVAVASTSIFIRPENRGVTIDTFILIRYNPDGSLDPGFGEGGIASVPLGNRATAAAGVLQPDGRIVVVGTISLGGEFRIAVARYNADGSLDSTFAGDGLALIEDVEGSGSDVALQSDGRIVVAGTGAGSDVEDFVLARFLGDGSLDATFGAAGRVLTDFPGDGSEDALAALTLQSDGKIVAAGSTFNDQDSIALARYLGPAPIVGGAEVPTLDDLGLVLLALLLLAAGAVILRRRRALGRALSTVLVTGALLSLASPAAAADGDLDPTFGSGGIVVTSFEFFSEILTVAIQPDGRILVGGQTGGPDPAIIGRFNADGSIDPTFEFQPSEESTEIADLTLLPDGRILAVGTVFGGQDTDVLVGRWEADGDFIQRHVADLSGDHSSDDRAAAIALQTDGKIVVGGDTTFGEGDVVVLRYDSNLVLDPGFGAGGFVITEIPEDGADLADLVLQPDGKIIAVVIVRGDPFSDPPLSSFFLIRYNADGSLDPGFGVGGVSTVSLGNPAISFAGALQPDGRILVAGSVVVGGVNRMAVARYNADGSLDSTFAGDGLALLDGVEGFGRDIAVLADGRILIAGTGLGSDANDFLLARFLGNGSLDASFGTGGRVLTDFPGSSSQEELNAIALQADGKVVAAGSTFSDQTSMALARYLGPEPVVGGEEIPTLNDLGLVFLAVLLLASGAVILRRRRALGRALSTVLVTGALLSLASPAAAADGDLDPTFGSGGIVVTNFRFFSRIFTVAVQPDGKIVVGGETGGPDPAVLVRYNADGSIDPTFLLESLPGLVGARAVRDLTLLPDGRIAAAGRANGGDDNGFIALWQADGTLDRASVINLLGGEPSDDEAFAVALQPDGKILVGGGTTFGNGGAFVSRYDANLNQDPGFGTGGIAVTEIAADGVRVEDLVLQPDGKIVAVVGVLGDGVSGPPFSSFTLIRYNPDGSVDPAFGHRGFAPGNPATAVAGALQPDGRIVVAGTVVVGGVNRIAVARYNAAGALDPTFAGDGVALLDGVEGTASDVVLLADGRILIAGTALGSDANDFLLARFLADGSPDASFGTAGRVLTDFPGNPSQEQLSALALQADGKVVAAGSTSDNVEDMALARYLGPVLGEEVPTLDELGLMLLALLLAGSAAVILRRRALGRALSTALVAGALMSMASPAVAADGDLDPTFGTGGRVTTDIGSSDQAVAVALQADGRIVAAGQIDELVAVVRYNADGSLDPTFGAGGFITTNVGGPEGDRVGDVVLLADGRIVVVGGADSQNFFLIRYQPDGSLDPTFGSGGIVITDISALSGLDPVDEAAAVAIQQDGRILAAGLAGEGGPGSAAIALARYLPDGTLDATFGTGGLVVTDLQDVADERASSLVVQPDGRVVVGGASPTVGQGSSTDFAVLRYNSNGTLDPTFGQAGVTRSDFNGEDDEVASLLLLPDGRIVAAGRASFDGQTRFALARYTTSGILDPTFGSGGLANTDLFGLNNQEGALGAALQADGKIIAAGFAETDDGDDVAFALLRYTSQGSLDPTFGVGGIVITDFLAGFDDRANDVVLQPDGRIVAAGFGAESPLNGAAFALARYLNAPGAIVAIPAVGDVGLVLLALLLLASATVILRRRRALGKAFSAALVAGALMSIASPAVAADGDLDPTFGTGGRVVTDFGGFDRAVAVALQADGKIVAVGQIDENIAVVRYNLDGGLDPTFGTGGFVTTNAGAQNGDRAGDVVVADGRILVVGAVDSQDFLLVRYLSDGSLDPSFGSGGIVTTDFSALPARATAVAVQQDGRILAAGVSFGPGGSLDFALARYLADGGLDATFGTGGLVVTDSGSNQDDSATSVVVQPDGRILVGGGSGSAAGGDREFMIARYDPDGTLDATFGQAGLVATDLINNDEIASLLLLADGRIVAVGQANIGAQTRFALARYTPSGALDPTFGSGGVTTTNLSANQDGALAAALQDDGKIVAAGFAEVDDSNVFALVRYNSDGSLDASFGAGGNVLTDFAGGLDDGASDVVIQPDGRIVAGGFAGEDSANGPAFALARYQNGSGTIVAIPTIDGIGMAVLTLLLLASAAMTLRRRRALDEN